MTCKRKRDNAVGTVLLRLCEECYHVSCRIQNIITVAGYGTVQTVRCLKKYNYQAGNLFRARDLTTGNLRNRSHYSTLMSCQENPEKITHSVTVLLNMNRLNSACHIMEGSYFS